MDKSFEKQIADKLNHMEVQPSDGLLDSIFAKRAARPKRFAGIGFGGMVLAVLLVSAGMASWLFWNNSGSQTGKDIAAQSDASIQVSKSDKALDLQLSPEPNANSDSKDVNRNASTKGLTKSNVASGSEIRIPSTQPLTVATAVKNSGQTAESGKNTINLPGYFDIGASGRPLIESENHKGNSHLYVYQSASNNQIEGAAVVHSRVSRIKGMRSSETPEEVQLSMLPVRKLIRPALSKRPLFVDLMFMPSLNYSGTSGSSDLKQISNAISKASFNDQYGVRLSMPVSNQFSVFTGLYFRRQSNHYKGELHYESEQSRIDQTIRYINDPSGNVIKIVSYDTVSYKAGQIQKVDHRNTFSLFQLPLGLSYNFGFKRFDFALHGSALINMFRNSSGHTLNLAEHNTGSFKSSRTFMGLGAGMSFMTAIRISPKFRFILEPGIQYFGINAIKAGSNIREKSLSPQMSIGIRYAVF